MPLIKAADIKGADLLSIVVLGGFGLTLLITGFIATDVITTLRRHESNAAVEMTVGRVIRMRSSRVIRMPSDAPGEYTEVIVEYYTRRRKGPFEVSRKLPVGIKVSYAKDDRVVVSYDVRTPRRASIAGRVRHWPDRLLLGPETGAVHSQPSS